MSFFFDRWLRFLVGGALIFLLFLISVQDVYTQPPGPALSYSDSAHGDSTSGVNRTSTAIYSPGHCAHCHEQHASINGDEPEPTGGAAGFCLLANNFSGATANPYIQSDNACFYCHYGTGTLQTPAFSNYTYARTFGGYTTDTTASIMDAFNLLSYHNLNDVLGFATANWSPPFTNNFNPCSACHNVHIAKRNKEGDPTEAAISKPSEHDKLWGDDDGVIDPLIDERMDAYTSNYQAPYYYAVTPVLYEPDNSATADGSNLPDYVTFCTDCHNSTNIIYSNTLLRDLKTINWETEKHGKGVADLCITVDAPYTAGSGSLGYVLSCLDCHEPHGSPNAFLIRTEVNGKMVGEGIGDANWHLLCNACHQDDNELSGCPANQFGETHHSAVSGDPYYLDPSSCGGCHSPAFTSETPVLMSDRTCKPIGEIKTGDKVLSFDFDNNAICESEVVHASNHLVSETFEINGVKTTHEQLFVDGKYRWVRADELKAGGTVLGLAEHTDCLEQIELEKPICSRHPKEVKIVEITVKDTHNFFVIGKEKSKFLVHNPAYDCDLAGYYKPCGECHYHGSTHTDPDIRVEPWITF